MKKILLLVAFSLLFTGCSAKYEVFFDENIVSESINIVLDGDINITGKNTSEDTFYIEDELLNYDNYLLKGAKTYYQKTINVKDNKSYVLLKGQYHYDQIQSEYNANACFKDVYVNNNDQYVYISLKDFVCELNAPIDLEISSVYIIKDNNAESYENGVYKWRLDDLKDNNDVELFILKEKADIKTDNSLMGSPVIKVIVISLLILTGIIIFIAYKKNSNK